MKRAALLAFMVFLAMSQQVSAAQHGISISCYDSAWAWFEVGTGYFKSTFVGVRYSDGKKVVVDRFGFCGDIFCGVSDSIDQSGILWKNHYVTADGGIGGHVGGC